MAGFSFALWYAAEIRIIHEAFKMADIMFTAGLTLAILAKFYELFPKTFFVLVFIAFTGFTGVLGKMLFDSSNWTKAPLEVLILITVICIVDYMIVMELKKRFSGKK